VIGESLITAPLQQVSSAGANLSRNLAGLLEKSSYPNAPSFAPGLLVILLARAPNGGSLPARRARSADGLLAGGRVTPRREALLARKGRLLYERACGDGEGSCVEGFARYHLGRGEGEAVRDLLAYLEGEAERLRAAGPSKQLNLTLRLVERIRGRLTPGGAP
jgi:hypothetical protein